MAYLAPISRRQFIDANGNPYSGGKIHTYLAGTTTPATTYQDSLSATPNTNPIVLDSEGRTPYSVWFTDDVVYKYAVLESDDTPVYTEDNVSGINDFVIPTVSEWVLTTVTCTYSSATVFTISGSDETATLHVGRRLKITASNGTNPVYATITVSSYAASTTTITYVVDSGTVANAAILVSYGLLSSTNPAVPKVALPDGSTAVTQISSDNTTKIATTAFARSLLVQYTNLRRQTIISAPIDTNGMTALGGTVGTATTVVTTAIGAAPASGAAYTTTMPLKVTAANGYVADVTGTSASNLTWTSINTSGTYYLYVDVDESTGALTTGSTKLEPIYQNGGAPSVTSTQDTFNIEQMVMWCGNGASAVQKYRVYVGQVDSTGTDTSNLIWYAVNGTYDSEYTATIPNASVNTEKSHNIGTTPRNIILLFKCTTASVGYAVGDVATGFVWYGAGYFSPFTQYASPLKVGFTTYSTYFQNKSTGVYAEPILTSWSYKLVADRGW